MPAPSATRDNYQLFADTVIQYEDTVNITKGAHNMHIGFQGWRQRIDTFYSGNNGKAGTFTFDGHYTAGPESVRQLPAQAAASPKPTSCWACPRRSAAA